jgi:hypothetical protein
LDTLIEKAIADKECEMTEGCAKYSPGKKPGPGYWYRYFEKEENINKRLRNTYSNIFNSL